VGSFGSFLPGKTVPPSQALGLPPSKWYFWEEPGGRAVKLSPYELS